LVTQPDRVKKKGRSGTYVITSGAILENEAFELVFLEGSVQVVEEGDVLRERRKGWKEGEDDERYIKEGGREGGRAVP